VHSFRRRVSPGSARRIAVGALLGLALVTQACSPAAATVNSRFFGMHVPGLDSGFPASLRSPVGAVNLTTDGVYWPSLEPTRGNFDFSHLDAVVAAAEARHAKPLLVLGQTPSWAGKHVYSAPAMPVWKQYVARVAGKYGARLDYEIWPEPNIIQNWTGGPKRLAQLTAAAAPIIYRPAKSAVVVGPAMALRLKGQQRFMDAFYGVRVGGKPVGRYLNAVGIDPYPLEKGTPEDSLALIKKSRSILHRHKVSAPLWNVEINYGVAGGHASVRGWSNHKQQSYVVRNYLLNAGANVKRVYWLGWAHIHEMAIQMVAPNGITRTPAGRSLGVVQTWLTGQRASACSRAAKTHVWSCKLVKKGHASWVYWVNSGKSHVNAPKGSRHIESMTGKSSRTRSGKRLTVTSAPIRVYH